MEIFFALFITFIGGLIIIKIGNKISDNSRKKEIYKLLKKINNLLTNEKLQNSRLPTELQNLLKINNKYKSSSDFYGITPNEPICVNGLLGEITYISMLRTINDIPFIGHRLGSINNLDVYEICSEDFSDWRIVYFDMYWISKDKLAPMNSKIDYDSQPFISATNRFISTFPNNIFESLMISTKELIGVGLVRPSIENLKFAFSKKPIHHEQVLRKVMVKMRAEGIFEDE